MVSIATTRNGKPTPFGLHGSLHVEGKHLIDEHGNICQLKGLSSHNLSSYPEYINEELLTQFTDEYNIELFRFAMYSSFADEVFGYADGNEEHRSKLESLIIEGVKTAARLGIYVIVDWHVLLEKDPNIFTEDAVYFFKMICPILKEYDNVIYEICNEPNPPTTWDDIKRYANRIIPIIREIDPGKVISVGTPTWSQNVDEASASPLSYDNLVYSLHFYSDSHKEGVRALLDEALDRGNIAVFVTEFGICDASGNGPINDEETDIWLNKLDENAISYCLWNLSNKDETSAILKKDCTKHSGFTLDDFSECGKRFIQYMKR